MTYQINRSVARWQVVDDEAVVVHAETSYYYGLNRVGTHVWTTLVAGAASDVALADAVAATYNIDPATALSDVRALLGDLVRESLVQEV